MSTRQRSVRGEQQVRVGFRPSRLQLLLGGAYAVALLAVVLLPIGSDLEELTIRSAALWNRHGLPGHPSPDTAGAVLNVVMFVPLGLLGVLLTRRPWWQVTIAAVLLSTCVELYQALPIVARVPSVLDVVTNGLGGAVGALLAILARRSADAVRSSRQRRA